MMIAYDRHSLYLYDIRENKLINVLKQYEQHFNTPLQIENLYPLSKGITWVTLNNGGCFRISDKECTVSSGIQYITAIDDVELGKSVGSLKINRERNGYLATRELAYLASGPLVHIPFLCSKQWIILFFLHHRMAG